MVGFLIVILALIFIMFAVLIYRQESSKFTKTTNYSLIDIWTRPDIKKASYFFEQLDRVEGSHEVLLNVDIPYDGSELHADAILIHESGVHILTTVYKNGWIVGHEHASSWVHIEHGDKKTEFENPLFYNLRIMYGIQEILPDIKREWFNNVVVFAGGCSFQNIELHSDYIDVIKLNEIKAWKNTLHGDALTKNDVDMITNALKSYSHIKKESKKSKEANVATN